MHINRCHQKTHSSDKDLAFNLCLCPCHFLPFSTSRRGKPAFSHHYSQMDGENAELQNFLGLLKTCMSSWNISSSHKYVFHRNFQLLMPSVNISSHIRLLANFSFLLHRLSLSSRHVINTAVQQRFRHISTLHYDREALTLVLKFKVWECHLHIPFACHCFYSHSFGIACPFKIRIRKLSSYVLGEVQCLLGYIWGFSEGFVFFIIPYLEF